jgi:hypothetical protein
MEIKVVQQKYDVAVIEYIDENGFLLRGIAPASIVNGNTIEDDRMSLVIPDCIDWVFSLEGTIRPFSIMDIARALYARRLWSLKDIHANPQAIEAALKSAMGNNVSAVIKAAEDYDSGGSNG